MIRSNDMEHPTTVTISSPHTSSFPFGNKTHSILHFPGMNTVFLLEIFFINIYLALRQKN